MSLHPLAGLESQICDLVQMVDLAIFHAEQSIHSHQKHEVPLAAREAELILFGLHTVGRMAADLKADFYEKFERGRGIS